MDALRKLEVWKRSCRLAVQMYKVTSQCADRSFRDQITRSALSVPSNISEGYERDSRKETAQYLRIAKGSCGELWTQLHIGMEAGFIDVAAGKPMAREAFELSKMLHGLIKRYNTQTRCTT